jgi:hypothetical protein
LRSGSTWIPAPGTRRRPRDLFHGPAGHWVETLTKLYTSYQMNTFVFWPENDHERQSRVFAEDVVPAVRAALAEAATSG